VNDKAKRTAAIARSASVFSSRPHHPRKLPRQALPNAIAREYGRALKALLSPKIMREAFADLMHELPALMESAKRERGDGFEARTDADEGKRARALIAQAKTRLQSAVSTSAIEQLAERYANATSTWQRIQLNRQTKAAFGVDIFTGDRNLRNRVSNFTSENVSLIKGITDDLATRVEKTVTRALTSATLHGDLADTLEEQFGYPEQRAELIARDQVGKLYGQINASRQQELGVERFTWRATHDDRTREEHAGWDGEVFNFDDPPINDAGEPVLPGEDILCRCWAEPVLSDIVDDA
jgi:SPP1 gp7 family putative phage head morphogenesis protein